MIKRLNYTSVKYDIETSPGEVVDNRIYLDKLDYQLPKIGEKETIILNNFNSYMYKKYKKALDNYFNNSYTNATDKLSRMFYNTYIHPNTIENFYNFSGMYKDYKNGKKLDEFGWRDIYGICIEINTKMISDNVLCIEISAVKNNFMIWKRIRDDFVKPEKIIEKFKKYCIEKDKENTTTNDNDLLGAFFNSVPPVPVKKTPSITKKKKKYQKKLQTKSCNIRLKNRSHDEIASLYDLDGIIKYIEKNSTPVHTPKSKKLGDCWKWNGSYSQSKTGLPQISILDNKGKVSTRTIRQAYITSTCGTDLNGKGIRTKTPICGYSDCVNPNHINLDITI